MIKLNYYNVNSKAFTEALFYLAAQSDFSDFKTTYNVSKIAKKFSEELDAAKDSYAKFITKFLYKDEAGNFVPQQGGMSPFKIDPEKESEFLKASQEFMEFEFAIDASPINVKSLGGVKLSPKQVIALEPILDPASLSQL